MSEKELDEKILDCIEESSYKAEIKQQLRIRMENLKNCEEEVNPPQNA